ncbi:MAG TPA: glucose-1-phosphate thymidylyltransferase RfbA [Candidatus Omnitrophota bacterium]|nr:glucose-1-phosphate thymidylyltransferase RfbA [Candidatus Omnitrophota bacterium]HPS19890.1 glucose-1-phosphate thymidylyltransferase RfbA [Candidatus Omnitrophota bacterium]
MRGIILAGGKATRLYPITKGVCKQLLPVYDKPMIYYPMSVLMLAGIRDIAIISTSQALPQFTCLFGDGSSLGLKISYFVQEEPRGIAEAFLITEDFIQGEKVSLVLGDNIFFGHGLFSELNEAVKQKDGATVFGYCVKDPERYGVIEFDKKHNVVSLEEKPKKPKSKWAVTGLYFYDKDIVKVAKSVKPSWRNELEITDVNKKYLEKKKLKVRLLNRGYAWLDTGTYDSLIDASTFMKTIEERQGVKIGCVEEVAYRKGYINRKELLNLAKGLKTSYGEYLVSIAKEEI